VQSAAQASYILPKKALTLLKNALANSNQDVEIAFSKSSAFFYFGNQMLVCRLIDARYPDFNAVIPNNNPNLMTIVRTDFLNSLKRISNYANKTTNQVKLHLTDGSLTIEAEDLDFSNKATEQMPCSFEGEEMTIGFNAKFLIDMLNVIGGEHVRLELSSPNRAGVLRPEVQESGEDLLMLVMPVMLNY
jgi:DNA polymerase-3 subunit beta